MAATGGFACSVWQAWYRLSPIFVRVSSDWSFHSLALLMSNDRHVVWAEATAANQNITANVVISVFIAILWADSPKRLRIWGLVVL